MKIEQATIETMLRNSFEDRRLSGEEKSEILILAEQLSDEQRRFARNRCFDIFRENLQCNSEQSNLNMATRWLERTLKCLDTPSVPEPDVFFSPGYECRNAIIDLCRKARHSIDICVFTISDNPLSNELVAASQRGVKIRIITDNDKALDQGSDVHDLAAKGIPVKTDNSPHHMHHKFAIIDNATLINGSFNWTRSASERNQENIMVSHHPKALSAFHRTFTNLWQAFEDTL